jgi:rhomboid family GlyGly-CTERM serine protease
MKTTISLTLLTLAAALIPGSSLELQRGGAVWRIVTCHFTHFTHEQLAWDALVFLILGIACARRNRWAFQATLLASIIIVPIAVLAFAPNVTTYRGLSGIDSALFALLLTMESRRSRLVALCAVGFVMKLLFEMTTGSTVFVSAADFAPVPIAHLAGAIIGLAIGTLSAHPNIAAWLPSLTSGGNNMKSFARYLLISAVLIPTLVTSPVFACSPQSCPGPGTFCAISYGTGGMDPSTDCWVYSGNASHITSGSCSPSALFSGGGSGSVHQDFPANGPGNYYYVQYVLDLNDPQATWRDELDIDIEDTSGNVLYHVATHTGGPGTISCQTYNVSLGYHPSWAGTTLRFEGRVFEYYSNVTYKLGGVYVFSGIS